MQLVDRSSWLRELLAKVLQVAADAYARLGRSPDTRRALELLEEAHKLCSDLADVNEKASVGLLKSK